MTSSDPHPLGYVPTSSAQRRAEAEAIYQLLKLVAHDARQAAGQLEAAGEAVSRTVLNDGWMQEIRVKRGADATTTALWSRERPL